MLACQQSRMRGIVDLLPRDPLAGFAFIYVPSMP